MFVEDYKSICAALDVPFGDYPDMDSILRSHPSVTLDTLVSIYSQECTRRVACGFKRISKEDNLARVAKRYLRGEGAVKISYSINVPPCVLMRLLLGTILGISKQSVSRCLKDPMNVMRVTPNKLTEGLTADDLPDLQRRLATDVEHCTAVDNVFSPYVDGLRNAVGKEYEDVLEDHLKELGIAYQAEDALRAQGQAKTPDVKLEVPIAVKGQVVHWIDSKACFCDEWTYHNKGKDQFQSYVNRYGPGMVIYWFGMVDQLNTIPDVLLVDNFPSQEDIFCLPAISLDAQQPAFNPPPLTSPFPLTPAKPTTPSQSQATSPSSKFGIMSPSPMTSLDACGI